MALEPILVPGSDCRDWTTSSSLEWLETNATGAFAMGTVSGANTRRYHGLFTASLRPPVDRNLLLARVEEEVLCQGELHNLGAAQYPGAITPTGFQLLSNFQLNPFPTWTYDTGCTTLTKRLFLLPHQQTAVLLYTTSHRCRFRLRPFLAFRDYHSLQHAHDAFQPTISDSPSTLSIQPNSSLPTLRLHHNAAGFVPVAHWYFRNEYRLEMERGLDFQEDLFSPGWLDFELDAGQSAFLIATIEDIPAPTLAQVLAWEQSELNRRPTPTAASLAAQLNSAADQFLVHRQSGSPTIIAGYPWFTDWGRDTMISIPGLLSARGRFTDAARIIEGFLHHLDRGLIPNRFPDAAESPEYNTADATLWLFIAAWSLRADPASKHFLHDTFYPAAREILRHHHAGTHYDIRIDPADRLLSAGSPGTQLTWMDAKVGDWVVTPRHGKPVEINALWYNALRITQHFAEANGDSAYAAQLEADATLFRDSFERAFWNPAANCLYDRLAPEGPDPRIRPNQIFALSLPFPLLDDARQRQVLDIVTARLLTPYGLRTLDPAHPEYRPSYHGGPRDRDGAYHQGTVWPWLIGPYISALLRVYGRSQSNRHHCRSLLNAFLPELQRQCLGQLPELYDADPPHHPKGAPAQAWSVAEILRVLPDLE